MRDDWREMNIFKSCFDFDINSRIIVYLQKTGTDSLLRKACNRKNHVILTFNYEACTGRKRFLSVEGAAHTKSYLAEPDRYMKEVSEFFRWELAEA